MKNKALAIILFLFLLVSSITSAQPALTKQWDKAYGGFCEDEVFDMKATTDGGFIIGGVTFSNTSGDVSEPVRDTSTGMCSEADYWILKTDSAGNKEWEKRFGGNRRDLLFSVSQTSDGGYILCGQSNSDSSGDKSESLKGTSVYHDLWMVKTDGQGNKQWDKSFGGNRHEYAGYVMQCADGGYFIAGHTASDSSGNISQHKIGNYDFIAIKTDSQGNKEWDKRFGAFAEDFTLNDARQTPDGGFIMGGYTESDIKDDVTEAPRGEHDYWVIKINSQGIKQWDKRYGGSEHDRLYNIELTDDGGYLFGGLTSSDAGFDISEATRDTTTPIYGNDFWIVKTDSLGNKQWDRRYGGNNSEYKFDCMKKTSDGGYLLSGVTFSNISGDKTENNLGWMQMWLVKINNAGNKMWDFTILTESTNCIEGNGRVVQTADGCFVTGSDTYAGIGGYKSETFINQVGGSADYWITKFCESEIVSSGAAIVSSEFDLQIFPNPVANSLHFSGNQTEVKQVTIYDAAGIQVLSIEHPQNGIIDVSSLLPGIYFAEIVSSKSVIKRKWVKL